MPELLDNSTAPGLITIEENTNVSLERLHLKANDGLKGIFRKKENLKEINPGAVLRDRQAGPTLVDI